MAVQCVPFPASVDIDEDAELSILLSRLQQARDSQSPPAVRAAEQELMLRFRRFAAALARRFTGRGVEFDDLVQLANVGLMKAVRWWRPQPAGGFLPYAKPMVLGELRRYFRDQAPMIRLPRRLHESGTAIAMARRDLAVLDREPTMAELAAAAGLSVDDVRGDAIARGASDVASLDEEHSNAEPVAPESARAFESAETRVMLRGAIAGLTERERRLLALRYFRDLTQEQIGEILGVSQMQVSRLLRRALTKLENRLAA